MAGNLLYLSPQDASDMRCTAELGKPEPKTQNLLTANVLCNILFLYCACLLVGTNNIPSNIIPVSILSKRIKNGKEKIECETEDKENRLAYLTKLISQEAFKNECTYTVLFLFIYKSVFNLALDLFSALSLKYQPRLQKNRSFFGMYFTRFFSSAKF